MEFEAEQLKNNLFTQSLTLVQSWQTCDDWYTNGHCCCFDRLLTVFDDMVHCWYTVGTNRHMSTQSPPNTQAMLAEAPLQHRTVIYWAKKIAKSLKVVSQVYSTLRH